MISSLLNLDVLLVFNFFFIFVFMIKDIGNKEMFKKIS